MDDKATSQSTSNNSASEESGLDLDGKDIYPLLNEAIRTYDHVLLAKLLSAKDIDQKWFSGEKPYIFQDHNGEKHTPLTYVLSSKFPEDKRGDVCKTAELLIKDKRMAGNFDRRTASVKPWNTESETALTLAIINFDEQMVRLLLDHGANPNTISIYQSTPLSTAFNSKKLETFKVLLERKYKTRVNALSFRLADGNGPEMLIHGVIEQDEAKFLEPLLRAGADINGRAVSFHNRTPLMTAALYGSDELMAILLSEDFAHLIELEFVDSQGMTALQLAVQCANRYSIDSLLKRKANVNHKARRNDPASSVMATLIETNCDEELDDASSDRVHQELLENLFNIKRIALRRLLQEKTLELPVTPAFSLVRHSINHIGLLIQS